MDEQCIHSGCEMPKGRAFGLCNAHYSRMRRGKPMDAPIRDVNATDSERFWSKVDMSGDCWVWTGARVNGYGVFRIGGRTQVAHRVAYRWNKGDIPPRAEVDHTCFNHSCVNPSHLRLLSHTQNGQNRASANRNSKSGVRGVYWAQGRWMARAVINRVTHEVGRFDDLEEAAKAISEWRSEHMPASINDQRKAV